MVLDRKVELGLSLAKSEAPLVSSRVPLSNLGEARGAQLDLFLQNPREVVAFEMTLRWAEGKTPAIVLAEQAARIAELE